MLIFSLAERHLSCFQFGAIVNKTAENMPYRSFCGHVFSFLLGTLKVGLFICFFNLFWCNFWTYRKNYKSYRNFSPRIQNILHPDCLYFFPLTSSLPLYLYFSLILNCLRVSCRPDVLLFLNPPACISWPPITHMVLLSNSGHLASMQHYYRIHTPIRYSIIVPIQVFMIFFWSRIPLSFPQLYVDSFNSSSASPGFSCTAFEDDTLAILQYCPSLWICLMIPPG